MRRVLRAVQIVVDEKLATPILVGRPAVIERGIKRHGLRIRIGENFSVVNPEHDERYREYWQTYHTLTERNGVTAQYAKLEMRRRTTLIAAMLLKKGEADGMICGTISTTARHLHYIDQVIGRRAGANVYGTMSGLILPGRQVVHRRHARQSGSERRATGGDHAAGRGPALRIRPRSQGGAAVPFEFRQQQCAVGTENARDPGVAARAHARISRWMAKCTAIAHWTRRRARRYCPAARCTAAPICLVCPNLDSASIAYNLLKSAAGPQCRHRSDTARMCRVGAHLDAGCHGAPHRQHDRHHGGERE